MNTDFALTLGVALCYLPFNSAVFACYERQTGKKVSPWLSHGATFVFNYFVFILVSTWQLHLPVNWMLIAVVYTAEVLVLYRRGPLASIFLGLSGALIGLALTIIARSAVAFCLDIPLHYFDSRAAAEVSAKALPIGLAFLLGGLLLWYARRFLNGGKFRRLCQSRRNLHFSLCFTAALYAYLVLGLLLYSIPSNEMILKLWSIKIGVCALAGYVIGVRQAVRESELEFLEEKSNRMRGKLAAFRLHEKLLTALAYTDGQTGYANRRAGLLRLEELLRDKIPLVLVFIDLNGLKDVNDTYGHFQGDAYIAAVAHVLGSVTHGEDMLCRYGGDEFLLILPHRAADKVKEEMRELAQTISGLSGSQDYPFRLSISYGIVAGDGQKTAAELLRAADAAMYAQKFDMGCARA